MSPHSIGMMLEPGESRVFPSADYESQDGCGLIPVGSDRCQLATNGYKWNLGKFSHPRQYAEISFKRFISTSNQMNAKFLGIDTDAPLFYCSSNRM